MRFGREDRTIEGGRKLYLYHFSSDDNHHRKQAMFWSAVSDSWRERPSDVEEWMAPVTERMLELLGPPPAEGRLLDLGCGAGSLPTPNGWQLVGLDIARPMLRPEGRSVVSGCHPLPFKLGSFDAIISRFALMFSPDPSGAFSEAWRVLRPGGKFVFSVWAEADKNRWSSALQEVLGKRLGLRPPQPHEPHAFRLGDAKEVRALLSDAGFDSEAHPVTVPYLQAMPPEEALSHLLAFAGPIRTGFDRLPESEREAALRDLLHAAAHSDRTGHATVWVAHLRAVGK
jgi:SAM-dependent methyltransferase